MYDNKSKMCKIKYEKVKKPIKKQNKPEIVKLNIGYSN